MKFRIEDNHLIIYDENDEFYQDATENAEECIYCENERETCRADHKTRNNNGQFCDWMKCKYEELIDKEE